MIPKESFVKSCRQVISYTFIGLTINVLGYLTYLALTHHWGHPKVTMTGLYVLASTISFLANRRFTFRHDGNIAKAGARYIFVQGMGYLLNLSLLLTFTDWLGYPHQFVQACAIFVVAVFLFLVTRLFVFRHDKRTSL